ncbi:MAG: PKD domain-containing protein [Cytophagales bacterium]|nr:PKD domain-containing protein [Cytophagales bacterium]
MKLKKLLLFGIAIIAITSISRGQAAWGVQVGYTYYDLQTNSAVRNGLVRNPDGTMATVWIQNHSGVSPQPDAADRGIGYNYFDGTSWTYGINGECGIPHGCASEYVGWPNIVWSDSMDEIVINHTPQKITRRPTQGSGVWGPTTLLPFTYPYGGDVWPRAVADGNYIHIICSSQGMMTPGGVGSPAVYYRSSDGGMTWDITNLLVPGMDDTTVIAGVGADSYAIDARNGTVAFTAGGFGEDWLMWKSTANGDSGTWTRTEIAPLDTTGKLFNGPGEWIVWTFDDAHAVTVDNNGLVHASVGQLAIAVDTFGIYAGFFSLLDDGLYYWNENMSAPLIVAGLVDLPDWTCSPLPCPPDGDPYSGIGNDFPTYFLGVTSMSQISVDQTGNPYIVYAGMVEWTSNTGDNTGQTFRDLYLVYSQDGGNAWSKPINIAGHPLLGNADDGTSGTGFEEDVYPMTNKMIGTDKRVHIVWQVDSDPGVSLPTLDGDPVAINFMTYYSFSTDSLPAWDSGAFVLTLDTLVINSGTCGNADGSINIGVSGGSGVVHADFAYYNIPYQYSIDSGVTYQDTSFFGSLASGIYYVFVKDVLATLSTIVIINDPGAPTLTTTSSPFSTTPGGNGTATVVLSGGGTPPYTITWNTGNPGDTTLIIDSLAGGTYSVTVVDSIGCTALELVTVENCFADFTFITSDWNVSFTDGSSTTGGNLSWAWDFGDASPVDSTQNPMHTYVADSTYIVCLTIMDSCGTNTICDSSVTVICSVPAAGFSFTTSDLAATFTDTSSGAVSWAWDFGDGAGTSTAKDTTYTYSTDSTYYVCLIVTNSCGNMDTLCGSVAVICSVPTAGFSFTTNILTATFTNTSSGAVSWAWDFGDGAGTDSVQNPAAYTYSTDSTYYVCLTVTNICGNMNTFCDSVTLAATGISPGELALGSVEVYPNPTNGTLNVELVNIKATNIMVYNLLGESVAKVNGIRSQLNANYTIDLSALANGTYIVKIHSADKVIIRRIFLNR